MDNGDDFDWIIDDYNKIETSVRIYHGMINVWNNYKKELLST